MSTISRTIPGPFGNRFVLTPGQLAAIFLAFGTIAVLVLAIIVPPFQNCDEVAHFMRADQISRGHLIGHRFGPSLSGGEVDAGIAEMNGYFVPPGTFKIVKASAEMFDKADQVKWGTSIKRFSFANTAIYAPFLYLPSVSGIELGKAAHISVLRTLWLARALSGLTAIIIGALAIALAGEAAPFIFTLLLLPMSLSETAAISQDGLIFSLAGLAIAILIASRAGIRPFRGSYIVSCLCLAIIVMAKPPYLPLAVVALFPLSESRRARTCGFIAVMAAGLMWAGFTSATSMVTGAPPGDSVSFVAAGSSAMPGSDPAQQVKFIEQHPQVVVPVIRDALHRLPGLGSEFIGTLGWNDTPLPKPYKALAYLMLAVTAFASFSTARSPLARPDRNEVLLMAAALIVSVSGIFATLYISFTPVGLHAMWGVQGRYLTPLALMAAGLPACIRLREGWEPARRIAIAAVAAFPVLSLVTTFTTVVSRYYF